MNSKKNLKKYNLYKEDDTKTIVECINQNSLPPEMKQLLKPILQQKKIKGTSSDLGALVHVIIKDVKIDRKLQALTIARRLLYCCPLHE
jgi:hypothetical protein